MAKDTALMKSDGTPMMAADGTPRMGEANDPCCCNHQCIYQWQQYCDAYGNPTLVYLGKTCGDPGSTAAGWNDFTLTEFGGACNSATDCPDPQTPATRPCGCYTCLIATPVDGKYCYSYAPDNYDCSGLKINTWNVSNVAGCTGSGSGSSGSGSGCCTAYIMRWKYADAVWNGFAWECPAKPAIVNNAKPEGVPSDPPANDYVHVCFTTSIWVDVVPDPSCGASESHGYALTPFDAEIVCPATDCSTIGTGYYASQEQCDVYYCDSTQSYKLHVHSNFTGLDYWADGTEISYDAPRVGPTCSNVLHIKFTAFINPRPCTPTTCNPT